MYPFGEDPIATYKFRYRSLSQFNIKPTMSVAKNSPLTVHR